MVVSAIVFIVSACYLSSTLCSGLLCFFFQAEDGIRDLVRSRGLGDVYKRQAKYRQNKFHKIDNYEVDQIVSIPEECKFNVGFSGCLLYTSDAADERSSVDLGGRRIIKKKNNIK